LATEVSRKEIKNFYENTLKDTSLTSELNLKEFLGELEITFLSFLNNHKRKAEITNKKRLDDIEQK
jgi:predicted transcriptional regulator